MTRIFHYPNPVHRLRLVVPGLELGKGRSCSALVDSGWEQGSSTRNYGDILSSRKQRTQQHVSWSRS
jgi:hypothetical protein